MFLLLGIDDTFWNESESAPDWVQMGGMTHFFSVLSKLYHFYSLFLAHKYIGVSDSLCFRSSL